MHRLSTGFILGYHGCKKSVGEAILAGDQIRPSANDWDWLGPGSYFWESNPQRALDWASKVHGPTDGFAIGAVIDPGLCLDLTTESGLSVVREGYETLVSAVALAAAPLPKNTPRNPSDPDRVLRRLDCAVIRMVHEVVATSGRPRIDTVKGVFTEGPPLYPGGDIRSLTHIQFAVCNLDCIKGVFRLP
jgi:hypothetical protein